MNEGSETMQPSHTNTRLVATALALCALLVAGGPRAGWSSGGDDGGGGPQNDDRTLKLRLNDAVGRPGGQVALVLRTYAARPLRQGRITVRVRRPPGKQLGLTAAEVAQPARPLTFVRCVVFSRNGDAVSKATPGNSADSENVGVEFSSASGGVNAADGPLAVIYMRLDPAVAPGSVFALEVDPVATGLTDAGGAAVGVDPIAGRLRVRAPSAPFAVSAEGDELSPGETAELGVETAEPFAVYGGRITLRYRVGVQASAPRVSMDPRFGKATFTVERSSPGLLVVSFVSPDGSLNSVPGRFLAVSLPTSAAVRVGSSSRVVIDPPGSWLLNRRGGKLPVTFEAGSLDFR